MNVVLQTEQHTEADEVVVTARRMWAADDFTNEHAAARIVAAAASDHSAESYRRLAEKEAVDEYYAMQDLLPFVKATTLTGAALQIAEAMNIVQRLMDDFETAGEAHRRKHRAVDRLLWSALDVVDEAASLKLSDVHRHAVSRCLNPWTSVEERIEMVRVAR